MGGWVSEEVGCRLGGALVSHTWPYHGLSRLVTVSENSYVLEGLVLVGVLGPVVVTEHGRVVRDLGLVRLLLLLLKTLHESTFEAGLHFDSLEELVRVRALSTSSKVANNALNRLPLGHRERTTIDL